MNVLFDQGVPVPIRQFLTNHTVAMVYELGWDKLQNGDLLNAAEQKGHHVLVTTDQNLKYQQNLQSRKISIVVLLSANWPKIRPRIDSIVLAIDSVVPGSYTEVPI
jgi:predicted nuclease of predicted toxin-antitoxin system